MFERPEGMHLAQINVARAVDDMESPRLASFVRMLDAVNAVAERSPGFVWRLKEADGAESATISADGDPRLIINMSVWESAETFEHFVWNTVHKRVYAQRGRWFEKAEKPHFAMWHVPAGHAPSVAEGLAKLAQLEREGPSAAAFGWAELPTVTLWMRQRCA